MSENVCRCGRCDIHLNIMFIKLYLGAQVIEKQRDSQGDTGEDWDMVSENIEFIRLLIDDYDEYNSEEDWG